MSKAFLGAVLLLVASASGTGCSSGSTCPSGARSLAQYTINYTAVNEGDTCFVTELADGGPADSPLVSTPSSNTTVLCASGGGDGGALQLFLGTTPLTSADQINFTATGSQGGVSGSACICPLDVSNSVTLAVTTTDGGPFAYNGDAGYSGITSFTGTFNYAFVATAGSGVACYCNVPCGAHYTIAGTQ